MSEVDMDQDQIRQENEKADVKAAFAVVVVAVLGAIHFVYTGGLPAFLSNVF